MKIKIRIRTPKGRAKSVQKKLQPRIVGKHKAKHTVRTNKNDDIIMWDVEGDPRHVHKIARNVLQYDVMMNKILSSKALRRAAKLDEEEMKILDNMLKNQTKIEII